MDKLIIYFLCWIPVALPYEAVDLIISRKHYGLSYSKPCESLSLTFKCMTACKSKGYPVFRMDFNCKCFCHDVKTTAIVPYFKWRTTRPTRKLPKTRGPELFEVKKITHIVKKTTTAATELTHAPSESEDIATQATTKIGTDSTGKPGTGSTDAGDKNETGTTSGAVTGSTAAGGAETTAAGGAGTTVNAGAGTDTAAGTGAENGDTATGATPEGDEGAPTEAPEA